MVKRASTQRTKTINIRQSKILDTERKNVKILLLGTSQSGKTTIVKEMKLIHDQQEEYEMKLIHDQQEEYEDFKPQARSNTLGSMQALVKAMDSYHDVEYAHEKSKGPADRLMSVLDDDELDVDVVRDDIGLLWKDEGIQTTFKRGSEFNLLDSCAYFMEEANIKRVFGKQYHPTTDDVLRCHKPTIGLHETRLKVKGLMLKLIDIGGKSDNTKRWLSVLTDINIVMFVVALSDYERPAEDGTSSGTGPADDGTLSGKGPLEPGKSKLHESLHLFGKFMRDKNFRTTPVILFLNKIDLFYERIQVSPLKKFFPAYSGGDGAEEAKNFLTSLFLKRNDHKRPRSVYVHATEATCPDNFKFIWKSTKHVILEGNLERYGLAPV